MSNQDNAHPNVPAGQGQQLPQSGPVPPVQQPEPRPLPGQQPNFPPGHQGFAPVQQGYPPQQGFSPTQPGYPSAPQGWVPTQQGSFSPPVNPDSGKKSKTKIVVIVIVGILVLAVGGFFAFRMISRRTGAIKPVAPSSIWLDKRYSKGVVTRELTRPGSTFVGVSSDRSVAAMVNIVRHEIHGEDLHTGEVKWKLDKAYCGGQNIHEGFAYCLARNESGKVEILKIDIGSGEKKTIYEGIQAGSAVHPKGVVDGNTIVVVPSTRGMIILSISSSGEAKWEKALPAGVYWDCELLGSHIGCSSAQNKKYFILDAKTGDFTVNETSYASGGSVVWLTDGYIVRPAGISLGKTDVVRNFSGKEIAKNVGINIPLFPTGRQHAFYSSGDVKKNADVRAVDAQGKVVLKRSDDGVFFVASGKKVKSSSFREQAVSSDGSVVLAKNDEKLSLFDSKGNHLHDINGVNLNKVIVRDGIIFVPDAKSTIYAPAV